MDFTTNSIYLNSFGFKAAWRLNSIEFKNKVDDASLVQVWANLTNVTSKQYLDLEGIGPGGLHAAYVATVASVDLSSLSTNLCLATNALDKNPISNANEFIPSCSMFFIMEHFSFCLNIF